MDHPPRPALGPDLDGWRRFRCVVRPHRDELWFAAEGELDLETSAEIKALFAEHMNRGFPTLVLDLRAVTFIDSTGLRTVIEAQKATRARGIDFALVPGPPGVQRLFELTGTSDLFEEPRSIRA
jgi:anti-anti-sigma factor